MLNSNSLFTKIKKEVTFTTLLNKDLFFNTNNFLLKSNNLYFSYIFNNFIKDVAKRGKVNKVHNIIINEFLNLKKKYKIFPSLISFFIFKKTLLPFEYRTYKVRRRKKQKQKPIILSRQSTLSRRIISQSLKKQKKTSLNEKIFVHYFNLLLNKPKLIYHDLELRFSSDN